MEKRSVMNSKMTSETTVSQKSCIVLKQGFKDLRFNSDQKFGKDGCGY